MNGRQVANLLGASNVGNDEFPRPGTANHPAPGGLERTRSKTFAGAQKAIRGIMAM